MFDAHRFLALVDITDDFTSKALGDVAAERNAPTEQTQDVGAAEGSHRGRCQVGLFESGTGYVKAWVSSLGRVSWAHSAQGDIPPDGVTLGAELSISGSGKEVSTRTEVLADGAERPEETLDMLGGLEPLQYTLAFAGRQV